jgi:hypothetical protein
MIVVTERVGPNKVRIHAGLCERFAFLPMSMVNNGELDEEDGPLREVPLKRRLKF